MRIVRLGVLLASILIGQVDKELLLPNPRSIHLTVLDEKGLPLKDAEIAHLVVGALANRGDEVKSDQQGQVQITTKAPLIVIRKTGYSSAFLRLQDTAAEEKRRVVLKPTQRTLPICPEQGTWQSLEGWQSWFRFAPLPQIWASKQGRDVDYGIRAYLVISTIGKVGITHGSGPLWSFGKPLDPSVWKSVNFEEDSFEVARARILDSRGEWADGTQWRSLAKLGETASYSGVDKKHARILNQFMDGVCLAPFNSQAR